MKKYLPLLIIAILFCSSSHAQFTRYIVRLKDKGTNPFSLSNPSQYLTARAIQRRTRYGIAIDSTDLPITPRYIDSIRLAGTVTILNSSKWLNQVAIQTSDAAALAKINAFPFVISAAPIGARMQPNEQPVNKQLDAPITTGPGDPTPQIVNDYYNYGQSFGQVHLHNGEFLHNRGFRGQGMQMAILDAGFYHYLSLPTFDSVRNNGQVLGTWDFVTGDASVDEDHPHGMNCFSIIAANMPGTFIGTAPKASFYLYRTEDVNTEYPIEEQNWAAGIERADSLGIDISSTSLGYNQFDNATFNHTYADLNGHTTLIAKAANLAARKGIIVVVAAGNEGNSAWHYIITPADADSAMAIGAVNTSGVVGSFSSYGPNSSGQIEPSVSAVGVNAIIANTTNGQPTTGNGTSFACPNMAGLTTCLWQAFPEVNNMSIIRNLQMASNRFNNPDNRTGYGIPNMKKAFVQLIKQLYTQQITLAGCSTTLQWTAKADSVITIFVERKLPTDINYIVINTQSSTGAFMARNFSYVDNLTGIPNGLIKYRLRMDIAADSSFYLDSATVNHNQNCSPQAVLTTSGINGFGTICVGSSSATASFTISGTNLPASNVVVAALTGYSYSTTAGGTYTASLSLTQPGGTYNQTIYVKFTPLAAISYNGSITVTCGSSSATVGVTGSGVNGIPSMGTNTASNITRYDAVLSGQLISPGCSTLTTDGIEYSTTNGFANGTGIKITAPTITTGSFSITAYSLLPGTTYYFKAYGTNSSGTGYGNQLSFTTLPLPDGLVVYNSPIPHSTVFHYSANGITPGQYGVRIINSAGQVVFKKEITVTANYVDDSFILPIYMPAGVYTLQLLGTDHSFKAAKKFIVR